VEDVLLLVADAPVASVLVELRALEVPVEDALAVVSTLAVASKVDVLVDVSIPLVVPWEGVAAVVDDAESKLDVLVVSMNGAVP
jgi:hypothetical protein